MRKPPARHALLLLALVALVGAADGKAARTQGVIPAFEVTISPNYVHPFDDRSEDLQAVWLMGGSPTTPYRSPDSNHHVQRYLLLDPRYRDADGRRGTDEWWFVIERSWPSSYEPAKHGKFSSEVNFHNVAGDAGPDSSGGVGWGFGRGISALALEWKPELASPAFSVNTQPNAVNMRLPVPERDVWHTYVVHWIAGRTDGSTVRPGAITVWADGGAKPVIDRRGINTVQRARGPDGNEYTQRWMQLWEGDYTSALPVKATTRLVLTRVGRTLREAVADRPRLAGTNLAGWHHDGTGADHGPPTARQLAPRPARLARLPRALLRRAG